MHRSHASLIEAANSALIVNGDLGAIGEFFSSDFVLHITNKDLKGGHDLIRRIVSEYRNAFHEVQIDIEILVETKDRVSWQRTLRAIHNGKFRGFPATGRPIVWRDMVTSRLEGGLIAEDWAITDLAERLLLAKKP